MLNMDFGKAVTLETSRMDWLPSPAAGVWRKPLAREEAERGHATSVVRYDAGAAFRGHNHPLGEEILVLEGTFSDETGDFPAGTYFRNPPGFVHAPFSTEGCVIFVKLHQFQPGDSTRLAIDTGKATWKEVASDILQLPLHSFGSERVALVRLASGQEVPTGDTTRGLELFVMSGQLLEDGKQHGAGTWLRRPPGHAAVFQAGGNTLLWLKTGHLDQ